MSKTQVQKYDIGLTSIYIIHYIISAALDLLVLYGYFRLGNRLSEQAADMVANSLRNEASMPDFTKYAAEKDSTYVSKEALTGL